MRNLFGNWLRTFRSRGAGRSELRATRLACTVREMMKLNWKNSTPEIWSAYGKPRYGYQIRLDQVVVDDLVVWMLFLPLHLDEAWLLRKLCIVLLQENNRYLYGSNRLIEGVGGKLSILHSHSCKSARDSAAEIADVGQTLLRQMQELVTRLYAEELLPPAEESPAPATSRGK